MLLNGGLVYTPPGQPPLSAFTAIEALPWSSLADAQVGDIDGNGTLDLLMPFVDQYFQYAFVPGNPPGLEITGMVEPYEEGDALFLADLDGDGLVDMVKGDPLAGGNDYQYSWSVRQNKGGSFLPTKQPFDILPSNSASTAPLRGTGDQHPYFVAKDGSGRGRLFYGARWKYAIGNGWEGPGDARGVSLDAKGTPTVEVFDDNDDAHYDKPSDLLAFADLNGDGVDELVKFDGETLRLAMWGGGERLSEPLHASVPKDPQATWRLLVFDMDADGRDDVLLERLDANHHPLSPAYRIFAGVAGTSLLFDTYPLAPLQVGDFDGDGRLDVLELDATNAVILHRLDGVTSDRITSVHVEGAPTERVEYSNQWWPDYTSWPDRIWAHSTAPLIGAAGPVNRPLGDAWEFPAAIRHGLTVVKKHDVYQGDDVGTWRHNVYSYADPRFDMHGRGFLGFTVVDRWQPDVPEETVTIYEGEIWSTFEGVALDFGHFKATDVYRITPTIRSPLPLVPFPARISHWNATWGGSIHDAPHWFHLDESFTEEWEQLVVISPLPDVAPHISPLGYWPMIISPSAASAPLLRLRSESYKYDTFANQTSARESTDGGTWQETTTTYWPANLDQWLVGLPESRTINGGELGTPGSPRTTWFHFDGNGLLSETVVEPENPDPSIAVTYDYVRNGDGSVTDVYGYDPSVHGSPTDEWTPQREAHVDYDADERMFVIRRWNAANQIESFLTHPAFGAVVATADVAGVMMQRQIDDLGNLRSESRQGEPAVSVTYAPRPGNNGYPNGVVVSTSSTTGQQTLRGLDPLGRTVLDRHLGFQGASIFTDRTYDTVGRLVSWSRPGVGAPGAARGTLQWDPLGRVTARSDPGFAAWTYQHEFDHTTWTDPKGQTGRIDRDPDGRVIASTQYLPALAGPLPWVMTMYSYGDFGALDATTLASSAKPVGHTTKYGYDLRGRRTFTREPDAGTTTVGYDCFGDVVSQTAEGSQTNYLLDALGRPTQATNADGTTTFTWGTRPHAPDKLAQTVSPDGVVHDRFYDSRGRLETETWTVAGESFSVHSHRDAFGRTDRIDYPVVQGVAPLSVSYAFDAFGSLESVGRTGGPETFWKTLAENEDGAPTSAVYGNGIIATRGYNPTTGQLLTAADDQLFSYTYDYDEKGRAKSRTDAIGHRTEDYHYDALDRLTSFTVSDAKSLVSTFAYGYDDFGNMISEQQVGKPKAAFGFGQNGAGPHELTSGPAGAYTYDSRGRVKTEPDAAFTFTEFDLPKTITPIVANSTGKSPAPTELQYDAEHTRVFQSGPAGYTLRIAGLYERREPAGKRPNPDKAVHVFYVVGPEGVVAQITASPHGPLQTFGEVAYVHHDRLGSTSVVSDASGKAQPALYYQPFGARSNFKGEAVGPPKTDVLLGFDGLRHDDNLGLIDQRGRVYEPATHRFLTPDPLVGQPLDSQSWNPYAFVRNSPVNRVDPSGFTEEGGGGGWFESIGSAVAGFFGSLFSSGGGSGGGGVGGGGSSHGSAHSTPHFTQVPQPQSVPGKSVIPTMPQGAPEVSFRPAWAAPGAWAFQDKVNPYTELGQDGRDVFGGPKPVPFMVPSALEATMARAAVGFIPVLNSYVTFNDPKASRAEKVGAVVFDALPFLKLGKLVGAGVKLGAEAKGAVATARTFTSADPLVADLANAIEHAYPGHVVGVNVPMRNAAGRIVTDADILLQNAVIQVKSGPGKGLTTQLLNTQAATNLPVLGYGPQLGGSLFRGIQANGGLVTRDAQLLIDVVAP